MLFSPGSVGTSAAGESVQSRGAFAHDATAATIADTHVDPMVKAANLAISRIAPLSFPAGLATESLDLTSKADEFASTDPRSFAKVRTAILSRFLLGDL